MEPGPEIKDCILESEEEKEDSLESDSESESMQVGLGAEEVKGGQPRAEYSKPLSEFKLKGRSIYASLYQSLFLHNAETLITDIKGVDFVPPPFRGERVPLKPICDFFCNNLILYKLVFKVGIEKSSSSKDMNDKSEVGALNVIICGAFERANIKSIMVKAKSPFSFVSVGSRARTDRIQEQIRIHPEMLTQMAEYSRSLFGKDCKISDIWVLIYKVDLQGIPFDSLILGLRVALEELSNIGNVSP